MNLREFCQIPNLPVALLTTYNIDPLFFERVILSDLIQGGATRIIILADADQAHSSISLVQGQLLLLGKRYRLIPIRGKGSFHPKVCVRFGPNAAVVACGSHNLTRAGWLGCRKSDGSGGNREATTAWRISPNTPEAYELRRAINVFAGLPDLSADRDDLRNLLTSEWVSDPAAANNKPWTWTVSGADQTLAALLAERWRGRRFNRIRVVCGSTDEHGAMLRWSAETFGTTEAIVEVDLSCCGFDPQQLNDLPLRLRMVPYDGQPRTHLKAVLFESDTECAAIVGSANCSGAAWLRHSREAGNIESAVVFDQCKPSDFGHLFRLGVGQAKPWDQVGLSGPFPTSESQQSPSDHRLRQLQLHRAAGEIIAIVDVVLPLGAKIFAVLQSSRVPLRPTTISNEYRGSMPDIIEGPETIFGHVEVESEGSIDATNAIWVDDVDRLGEASGRHHRYDSVRRLSSLGISADYKRLLEDLQVLSQVLLSTPDAFPDGAKRPPLEEKKDAANAPEPVTAADVIRTLDQLAAQHENGPNTSAFSGTISLTGIMRILFMEGSDAAEVDPTEAEHQRSTEEQENEQNEKQDTPTEGTGNEDSGPTEAQRQRLANQLKQFVDHLAAPEFSSKCSARQLQQAVAFPLAIAKFASRGPWVQEAEFVNLAETIERTCEILFFRNYLERNPKTGVSVKRTPLFGEVRNRYLNEGRVEAFDQILGDGALWLVLLGALALLAGTEDRLFTRNLILRDIAQHPSLSSSVVPEQLAGLARRIRSESDVDPLAQARQAVVAFRAVEEFLTAHYDDLKQQQRTVDVKGGDWLWNPNVAFAQVICLGETGKAFVHIRKRAETLEKPVLLSYYINLRLVAEQNREFADLLAACTAR